MTTRSVTPRWAYDPLADEGELRRPFGRGLPYLAPMGGTSDLVPGDRPWSPAGTQYGAAAADAAARVSAAFSPGVDDAAAREEAASGTAGETGVEAAARLKRENARDVAAQEAFKRGSRRTTPADGDEGPPPVALASTQAGAPYSMAYLRRSYNRSEDSLVVVKGSGMAARQAALDEARRKAFGVADDRGRHPGASNPDGRILGVTYNSDGTIDYGTYNPVVRQRPGVRMVGGNPERFGLEDAQMIRDRGTASVEAFLPTYTESDADDLANRLGFTVNTAQAKRWKLFMARAGFYGETQVSPLGRWAAAEQFAFRNFLTYLNDQYPDLPPPTQGGLEMGRDLVNAAIAAGAYEGAGGGGGGGGGGGQAFVPYTTRSTNTRAVLSTLEEARATLRSQLADMIGRWPTDGEVKAFLARLNERERANPLVTTVTTNYTSETESSSSTQQSGGEVDVFDVADTWAKKSLSSEYADYQKLRYVNDAFDMLLSGGLPSSAPMVQPGV